MFPIAIQIATHRSSNAALRKRSALPLSRPASFLEAVSSASRESMYRHAEFLDRSESRFLLFPRHGVGEDPERCPGDRLQASPSTLENRGRVSSYPRSYEFLCRFQPPPALVLHLCIVSPPPAIDIIICHIHTRTRLFEHRSFVLYLFALRLVSVIVSSSSPRHPPLEPPRLFHHSHTSTHSSNVFLSRLLFLHLLRNACVLLDYAARMYSASVSRSKFPERSDED